MLTNQVWFLLESFNLLLTGCLFVLRICLRFMASGLIASTIQLDETMAPLAFCERNHSNHTGNMKQHRISMDIVGWHVDFMTWLAKLGGSVMGCWRMLYTLIMWWNRHSFLAQHWWYWCKAPLKKVSISSESQEALHQRRFYSMREAVSFNHSVLSWMQPHLHVQSVNSVCVKNATHLKLMKRHKCVNTAIPYAVYVYQR